MQKNSLLELFLRHVFVNAVPFDEPAIEPFVIFILLDVDASPPYPSSPRLLPKLFVIFHMEKKMIYRINMLTKKCIKNLFFVSTDFSDSNSASKNSPFENRLNLAIELYSSNR